MTQCSSSLLFIGEGETQYYRIMVREWRTISSKTLENRRAFLIGCRDASPRKPIQLERTPATSRLQRPVDKPETPSRYPFTHVLVCCEVLDGIVERTGTRNIQTLVVKAPTLQILEHVALKPPVRVWVVINQRPPNAHQDPQKRNPVLNRQLD